MAELTASHIEYLAGLLMGRLATAGADHRPHVVPTSFRNNDELGTVDVGGHRVAATKKYRDVQANGWAAIVIDDLGSTDPWTPRMLEIRARAEAIPTGGAHMGPGFGVAFIRITLRRSTAWALRRGAQSWPADRVTPKRSGTRPADLMDDVVSGAVGD